MSSAAIHDSSRPRELITHASEAVPVPSPETAASRWWTARRAAAYIDAGPKEIYKAVRTGKLKAVRLNRRGDIRTLREWVDEWMELMERTSVK